MQSLSCYDIEAKEIDKLCEEYDVSEAEIIEALISAVLAGDIDLGDYL